MCITLWWQTVRAILSIGIKITKPNRLSMELADYNKMFAYIESKNNVLAYAIS